MADKLLKSIKFPTLPDRYVIGDSTLTEEGAAADAKAVGDALATKADTKGRYEDLIVGGAEQLMADEYETDKEPYLFRTTGGSADVGNREYLDKIVGGTVAWNQLIPNPTSPLRDTSMIVFNSGTQIIKGHRYIVAFNGKKIDESGNGINAFWYVNENGGADPYAIAIGTTKIITPTRTATSNGSYNGDNNTWFYIGGISNATINSFNVIDLTAMFGSTIADYIYSLEQATAGAGVAWVKRYIDLDTYHEYDAGSIQSVEGLESHDVVGFNQWDEEWRNGYYDMSTGAFISNANYVANKNLIPVFPETSYYFNAPSGINRVMFFYDVNGDFLSRSGAGFAITTFDTPANCAYMAYYIDTEYGNTYNHDICINLSDPTRNGEYEPYQKHSYPLDSSLTLRGVPKLADGKLAFDGDRYLPEGKVERRYGEMTFEGSADESIVLQTQYNGSSSVHAVFMVDVPNMAITIYGDANGLFPYGDYKAQVVPDATVNDNWTIRKRARNSQVFIFAPSSLGEMTVEDFKTHLSKSKLMFLYELATPTTETAEGYEQYQRCDPSGTEEYVTTGIVPVGHETRYPHDLKKKIETAPDSPSTDGTYLMKRSGGKNSYMALPSTPSANGAYVLTVTVSGGNASYSWTAKG